MSTNTLKTRIIHKHDTSTHWALATNFVPKQGEIIIYDDLNRVKIGDGVTNVNSLDFILEAGSQISIIDNTISVSTDSTHRFVTDSEKSTWNDKQDAITSTNKLSIDKTSGWSTATLEGTDDDGIVHTYTIMVKS